MDKEKILEAGKIAKQVREFIRPKIRAGQPLLEIAELIENKISELNKNAKPAFPTNLSTNEIAAHYTPAYDDKTLAHGLLKVDFGVHIDGWISDQAFSVDLENSPENKKLITASEKALEKAIEKINSGISVSEIGKSIQKEISSLGFNPIVNLSGHEIKQHDLHAGLTIPNYENNSTEKISSGLYAIEPFATSSSSSGKVRDGQPSGIYNVQDSKPPRSPLAREILDYVLEEYYTLPFCSRWLVKKFGTKALLVLKQLEQNGNLHQYSQLVEYSKSPVAQSEHTVFIDDKGEKIITTL
jgi:methionyl aminopeptidase